MLSPFSNEIKKFVYSLDMIPKKDDLLISSIGSAALCNRIKELIAADKDKSYVPERGYELFGEDNFVPIISFSNNDLIIYNLNYKDAYYENNDINFTELSYKEALDKTRIVSFSTYKENGIINDKKVLLISTKYAEYLSDVFGINKYYDFIKYITEIIFNSIIRYENGKVYYTSGVLLNGKKYISSYHYFYLAIIYHLYCKYANDDILLPQFYNSLSKFDLFESYDDFVQLNEKLKEKLN